MFGKRRVSLELIDAQNDDWGKHAEIACEAIIAHVNKESMTDGKRLIKTIPEIKLLADMIFKRFGIRVEFIHSSTGVMGVLPMILNKYHVFLNKVLHGFEGINSQEAILSGWQDRKGSIDLKKAKVSGIFSEYTHQFFINLPFIVKNLNFTASEMVGCMLHEIGHLFNNYEYSDRLESTNVILAQLSTELKNNTDSKKIDYVFKQYLDITQQEKIDIDIHNSNRIILGGQLVANYFSYVKSQWPVAKYDETGSEVAADAFASRFGYGKEIVIALDKIERLYGMHRSKITLGIAGGIYDIINLGIPLALSLTLLSLGAIPVGLLWLGITGLALYGSGADLKDMTYDDLKDRYIRIRQQCVQMLKDSDVDPKTAKDLLEQIYAMDAVIKSTGYFKPMTAKISNLVFSRHRQANDSIQLQRMLEELAHNDLFIRSAEFNASLKTGA